MQLGTEKSKRKIRKLMNVSEFETKDHVLVLACTETGVLLPLSADGRIQIEHQYLSREIGEIKTNDPDEFHAIMNKRVRSIAWSIVMSSPLQEVHLPRHDQIASAAIMLKLKKHQYYMKIYKVLFLRAEQKDAPGYVHVAYEELLSHDRLCPELMDTFEQLEELGCFGDFVTSMTETEED